MTSNSRPIESGRPPRSGSDYTVCSSTLWEETTNDALRGPSVNGPPRPPRRSVHDSAARSNRFLSTVCWGSVISLTMPVAVLILIRSIQDSNRRWEVQESNVRRRFHLEYRIAERRRRKLIGKFRFSGGREVPAIRRCSHLGSPEIEGHTAQSLMQVIRAGLILQLDQTSGSSYRNPPSNSDPGYARCPAHPCFHLSSVTPTFTVLQRDWRIGPRMGIRLHASRRDGP